MAAVHELDYSPNGIARSMASRRTMTLALVVSDVTNPFFTSVARGVEDVARGAGYGVLLCNTDEDLAVEKQYLDLLRQRRVEGILLVPAGDRPDHIQATEKSGVKVVLLDRHIPSFSVPSVEVDNVGAMRMATEHLVGLGHREIALIAGRPDLTNSRERVEGYTAALGGHGVPLRPGLILNGRFSEEGGHECGLQIAQMSPRPTAVISCNNVMTTGLLLALREASLMVPGDISVISFDDLPYFSLLDHPLTAILQPMYELGQAACRLLLDLLSSPSKEPAEMKIRLPTRLVLRDSCLPMSNP